MFELRQQENKHFVPTKASKEVEYLLQNQNLVIVKGRPGSGKSAIIKHIALKYLGKGWIVKPVKMVDEMFKICHMEKWSCTQSCLFLMIPLAKIP